MYAHPPIRQEDAWTKIEADKRLDRTIRRVSIIAWSVTLAVLLFYAALTGVEVARALELMEAGAVGPEAVFAILLPLVKAVGALALLIAVLSTVGVFLRLRTASLNEIQLRLAALENMLLSRPAPDDAGD